MPCTLIALVRGWGMSTLLSLFMNMNAKFSAWQEHTLAVVESAPMAACEGLLPEDVGFGAVTSAEVTARLAQHAYRRGFLAADDGNDS